MSNKTNIPKPPSGLRPKTREWFSGISEQFVLESHHQKLLAVAALAWDRKSAADEALAKHGLTFDDANGKPTARPECKISHDASILFMRALRELCLDVSTPDDSRPPVLKGNK